MTPTPKRTVICAVAGMLFSMLIATAYSLATASSKETLGPNPAPLGIEIALKKPFYVPAGETTKIFIRVPVTDVRVYDEDSISAIKLEPRMEGDKVRVTLYLLTGEPDDTRTCSDWDRLTAKSIGSYLAAVDEEVGLVKLREFGVAFGKDPLTFRVVPKRVLSPVPQEIVGGCQCSGCGQSNCCPNPGMCLECEECGFVCCRPS